METNVNVQNVQFNHILLTLGWSSRPSLFYRITIFLIFLILLFLTSRTLVGSDIPEKSGCLFQNPITFFIEGVFLNGHLYRHKNIRITKLCQVTKSNCSLDHKEQNCQQEEICLIFCLRDIGQNRSGHQFCSKSKGTKLRMLRF